MADQTGGDYDVLCHKVHTDIKNGKVPDKGFIWGRSFRITERTSEGDLPRKKDMNLLNKVVDIAISAKNDRELCVCFTCMWDQEYTFFLTHSEWKNEMFKQQDFPQMLTDKFFLLDKSGKLPKCGQYIEYFEGRIFRVVDLVIRASDGDVYVLYNDTESPQLYPLIISLEEWNSSFDENGEKKHLFTYIEPDVNSDDG